MDPPIRRIRTEAGGGGRNGVPGRPDDGSSDSARAALVVAKDEIAANGDYNLSGGAVSGRTKVVKWPHIVGDVFRKLDN